MTVNVAKMVDELRQCDITDFWSFNRLIEEKFPDATVDEVDQAFKIALAELLARGITPRQAAKLKAAGAGTRP
jgi:hypothetical protein